MDLTNFDGDEAAEFLNGRMKQMLGDKYDKVTIIIIIIILYSQVFRKLINIWTRWMTLRRCWTG